MSLNQITQIRSTDRVLSLSPIDDKAPKTSTGLLDPRLFTGAQKLHIKMDPQTCLWYFQYESNGVLPEALKGKYTGFKAAIKFAENYFAGRNVKITQVFD